MASSLGTLVKVSAEDLDFFSKFLETEGLDCFEIALKDSEDDLVEFFVLSSS